MAIQILKKIGDRNAERGSTVTITNRAVQFIKDCQVELLVLDELHHFISRDNCKVLTAVADWLKFLLLETRVPIVALGKPEASEVVNSDPQIARRFAERYEITPFRWDYNDPDTIAETRRFLTAVDFRLPLAERSSLGSLDIAGRIHYATDGVVGYMMMLLREAATIAIEESQERITLDHLSRAFQTRIKTVKIKKENPFVLPALDPEQVAQWLENERNSEQSDPPKLKRRRRVLDVLRTR